MKKLLWLVIFLVPLLTACSEPPPVEHAHACDVENDGQKIAVEGYLTTGYGIYCSNVSGVDRCGFTLVATEGADDSTGFNVDLIEGKGRNKVAPIDSSYEAEDLVIKTNDKTEVGLNDHIRVIGKISVSEDVISSDKVCYMYVNTIESVE